MAFSRYKKYYVQWTDENSAVQKEVLTDLNGEPYYSNEFQTGLIPDEEIIAAVRAPIHKRYYKVYLLHDDETIKEDITKYVLPEGSIEKTSESGQCRSANLTLINEKQNILVGYKGSVPIYDYQNIWTPRQYNNKIWNFNKVKIVIGMELYGMKYELDEGIFVIFDPSLASDKQTVSAQLYDKFSLLDGTIDGKSDLQYTVPIGTPVDDAIRSLLKLPKNRKYDPYDFKRINFPSSHKGMTTPYTLEKTGENTIGDIIKDLSLMISCDAKYNEVGNLEISDILADLDYHNRKMSWNFNESKGEIISPSASINKSKIKNRVYVVGANVNGYLVKGAAENTNPTSIYNVNGDFGVKSVKITDDLIASDELCKSRARYELKKYSQNYININFSCPYIPHIEPEDVVRWSYKDWNIENEEFVVNSVSIPLNETDNMSLSITNLKELPMV